MGERDPDCVSNPFMNVPCRSFPKPRERRRTARENPPPTSGFSPKRKRNPKRTKQGQIRTRLPALEFVSDRSGLRNSLPSLAV